MNIIDHLCIINKYNDDYNTRHISAGNNIASWISLKSFTENITNIVKKYRRYLNQLNINIIKNCISYDIKIIPILYRLSDHDIESLIYHDCPKFSMLKFIRIDDFIDDSLLIFYLEDSIINGHINFIKYLYKKLKYSREYFKNLCWCVFKYPCLKYMHKEIGFLKEDFMSKNPYICGHAFRCGDLNYIKYIHEEIKLTKEDFKLGINLLYRRGMNYNKHPDIVEYLQREFGLSENDFSI